MGELEGLKQLGQIAGIGGIALGVLLLVFRDVIRKAVFPRLSAEQGFGLLKLILILVWTVALAGIAAYAYVETRPSDAPNGTGSATNGPVTAEPAEPIKLLASPVTRIDFDDFQATLLTVSFRNVGATPRVLEGVTVEIVRALGLGGGMSRVVDPIDRWIVQVPVWNEGQPQSVRYAASRLIEIAAGDVVALEVLFSQPVGPVTDGVLPTGDFELRSMTHAFTLRLSFHFEDDIDVVVDDVNVI